MQESAHDPATQESKPAEKIHRRATLILIASIGAITGPFMASGGWWFVIAIWALSIPGFVAVQKRFKASNVDGISNLTTPRLLMAFLKPFLLWSGAAAVLLLIGAMVVGAISGEPPSAEGASPVDQPQPSSKVEPQEEATIKHPIRYPTNAEIWTFSAALPAGFQPQTEYAYELFRGEVRRTIGQDTTEGQWLKCTLGTSDENPVPGCQQSLKLTDGFWRVVYYENINQTWLEEVRHYSDDVANSTVKILKVAEGRRPNLNIE
jgi:hypothetical protein